jgi:hypothetical protein
VTFSPIPVTGISPILVGAPLAVPVPTRLPEVREPARRAPGRGEDIRIPSAESAIAGDRGADIDIAGRPADGQRHHDGTQ